MLSLHSLHFPLSPTACAVDFCCKSSKLDKGFCGFSFFFFFPIECWEKSLRCVHFAGGLKRTWRLRRHWQLWLLWELMSFISWCCVAVGFYARVLCWWQMNNLLWVQDDSFQSQGDHYRKRGCQWLITIRRTCWELQNGRNRWAGWGLGNGAYFS